MAPTFVLTSNAITIISSSSLASGNEGTYSATIENGPSVDTSLVFGVFC
jgi:hypothetical protein